MRIIESFKLKKSSLFVAAALALMASYSQASDADMGFESFDGMLNSNDLHLPIQNMQQMGMDRNVGAPTTPRPTAAPKMQQTRSNNQPVNVAHSNVQAGHQLSSHSSADQLLIQGLSDSSGFDQVVRDQLGDGLSPEEIQLVKEAFLEYEAAKNNPEPPPTRSTIKQLNAGDTFELMVMSDFPATLMFADQFGAPLTINYHDLGAGSVVEVREMRNQKGDIEIVDGLRIHALKPMRSTSLTVRTSDSRLPINITIKTIPADGKTSVAVLNELRLSWVNKLSQIEVAAGRYTAPDIAKRGDKIMMDVVTGTLLSNEEEGIHKVLLEGEINSALFVDETTGFWYLRLPIDTTPQNVAIESQALSSINGYRVIRMKAVPPRVIGVTANGRSYRLVMQLDRRLSHVQQ